jgi:hypothetical protein
LCPFGSGGINNNRVIDLESSGTDARHEVYNNDAQIEEPEGGNTFNRNFLFLYATGGSIDDVLSAYNKITRVGTASETYRFNDVTSAPELRVTNIVFCKDQTDGVEISVANAGTYVSDPGTEPADYTVDEDGTCDCEPACGPALGVRPM